MKKLTTEQFIEKAKRVHGNRYDYSKLEYIDARTKVIIICKEHGEFKQKPVSHLRNHHCDFCAKENRKQTNIERYGVSCSLHNKKVAEKVKQTNIIKRGCEYPTQNKCVKEKVKQTNIERYGVCRKSSNVKKILPLITDKEWLFEQYMVLGKTAVQIAQELNISDGTVGKYLKQHEIEIRYTVGYSRKAVQWLESIMEEQNIFIQHAGNIGEYQMPETRFKVDGYCNENNTVYEFHGDCFHGNPDLFKDDDKPNFYQPELTAKELYNNTIERENKIKELDFNLVVMWENDYNKLYSSR
jgi:flagellar biosynthesis/type III secretory pathway chaperone